MFWVRYLLTAIFGTVLLYYSAPFLYERYKAGHEDDETVFIQPSSQLRASSGPIIAQNPVFDKEDFVSAYDNESRSASNESSVENESPDATSDSSMQNIAQDEPQRPKYSLDIIPQSEGNIIRWGVVRHDAGTFKPDGKRISKKAPAGTLIEIISAVMTKQGNEMANCSFWVGSTWSGPYLISSADLIMFDGTRDQVLASDVENLCRFYKLNGLLVNKKAAFEEKIKSENPHYESLKELATKNNEMADRVARLTKERDESTGGARIKAAEELRKLEVENTKLQQELKRKVSFYNDWKKEHSKGSESVENNADYKAVKRQMDEIRPLVRDFGVEE